MKKILLSILTAIMLFTTATPISAEDNNVNPELDEIRDELVGEEGKQGSVVVRFLIVNEDGKYEKAFDDITLKGMHGDPVDIDEIKGIPREYKIDRQLSYLESFSGGRSHEIELVVEKKEGTFVIRYIVIEAGVETEVHLDVEDGLPYDEEYEIDIRDFEGYKFYKSKGDLSGRVKDGLNEVKLYYKATGIVNEKDLQELFDKNIKEYYNENSKVSGAGYTLSSWYEFDRAMLRGKELLNKKDKTQLAVNQAIDQINYFEARLIRDGSDHEEVVKEFERKNSFEVSFGGNKSGGIKLNGSSDVIILNPDYEVDAVKPVAPIKSDFDESLFEGYNIERLQELVDSGKTSVLAEAVLEAYSLATSSITKTRSISYTIEDVDNIIKELEAK